MVEKFNFPVDYDIVISDGGKEGCEQLCVKERSRCHDLCVSHRLGTDCSNKCDVGYLICEKACDLL